MTKKFFRNPALLLALSITVLSSCNPHEQIEKGYSPRVCPPNVSDCGISVWYFDVLKTRAKGYRGPALEQEITVFFGHSSLARSLSSSMPDLFVLNDPEQSVSLRLLRNVFYRNQHGGYEYKTYKLIEEPGSLYDCFLAEEYDIGNEPFEFTDHLSKDNIPDSPECFVSYAVELWPSDESDHLALEIEDGFAPSFLPGGGAGFSCEMNLWGEITLS